MLFSFFDEFIVRAELLQSCPTLCDPTDCSLPGSSVHGIFQAKKTGVGCYIFPSAGDQVAISLTPDIDRVHIHVFESSKLEGEGDLLYRK